MEVNDSKTKETEKVELSSMEFVNELEDLEQQFIKKLLLLKKKKLGKREKLGKIILISILNIWKSTLKILCISCLANACIDLAGLVGLAGLAGDLVVFTTMVEEEQQSHF